MLINSMRYKFILMFFDGKISLYGLLDLMGKSVTLSNLEATKKQQVCMPLKPSADVDKG